MESGTRYFLALAISKGLEIKPEQVTDEFIDGMLEYQKRSNKLRMLNDPPLGSEESVEWDTRNKIWAKLVLAGISISCCDNFTDRDLVLDEEKQAKFLEIKNWAADTLGYHGPIC
jgi:hypothetical protein